MYGEASRGEKKDQAAKCERGKNTTKKNEPQKFYQKKLIHATRPF